MVTLGSTALYLGCASAPVAKLEENNEHLELLIINSGLRSTNNYNAQNYLSSRQDVSLWLTDYMCIIHYFLFIRSVIWYSILRFTNERQRKANIAMTKSIYTIIHHKQFISEILCDEISIATFSCTRYTLFKVVLYYTYAIRRRKKRL